MMLFVSDSSEKVRKVSLTEHHLLTADIEMNLLLTFCPNFFPADSDLSGDSLGLKVTVNITTTLSQSRNAKATLCSRFYEGLGAEFDLCHLPPTLPNITKAPGFIKP